MSERITRDLIDDFRRTIKPFVANHLYEENFEDMGKSDKEEFEEDFDAILDLAIEGLKAEPCPDAISKQEVVCIIESHIHEIITESGIDKNAHTNRLLRAIANIVKKMPPVHADVTKYAMGLDDGFNEAIDEINCWITEEHERQVAEGIDLISRQKAIAEIRFGQSYITKISPTGELEHLFSLSNKALEDAAERIEKLPSAFPDRLQHLIMGHEAKDILKDEMTHKRVIRCQNCKYFHVDTVDTCLKWGSGHGCRTHREGFCYLAEHKGAED